MQNTIKNENFRQNPKIKYGLIQIIRMDTSANQKKDDVPLGRRSQGVMFISLKVYSLLRGLFDCLYEQNTDFSELLPYFI